jgi:hypothetical protein
MMDQVFGLAAAIARRVFELNADLGQRLAFSGHFTWREMPFMMARHPARIEIAARRAWRTKLLVLIRYTPA